MFEKIRDLMVDTLSCDLDSITPSARLAEDLDIDSLDAVELNMAIEEAMNITIPDGELMNLKTVGDIVAYLEANAG
ncbi:Acyl carrier protein [bioreactor metagenome]|uniref:Acyl carrier protein n=1 Tax=bioreactor metagenome TaxID=1076179 RepID=A0A645F453_9ZZZZ